MFTTKPCGEVLTQITGDPGYSLSKTIPMNYWKLFWGKSQRGAYKRGLTTSNIQRKSVKNILPGKSDFPGLLGNSSARQSQGRSRNCPEKGFFFGLTSAFWAKPPFAKPPLRFPAGFFRVPKLVVPNLVVRNFFA